MLEETIPGAVAALPTHATGKVVKDELRARAAADLA
jgi:hypothetical protein